MANLSIAYILRLRDEFSTVAGKVNNSMKGLEDKFSSFNNLIAETGQGMQSAGKSAFAQLTVPILGASTLAVKSFHDFEQATARLESSLVSTGGAAGVTMDQMLKKADELQSKTLFGNDKILNDVTSRLLTFANITEDQFFRAHDVILDMATKLKVDLGGAAKQLGRALNDPAVGLSLLSRAGITLSDDAKELILSLHEVGRTGEAQTIIFDELEKAFKGSAEAAAKAGLGPFIQQWNSLMDAIRPIGKIIVEIMEQAIPFIERAVAAFDGLSDSNKKLIVIIGGVLAVIGPMLIFAGALILGISRVSGVVLGLIKVFRILTFASPFGLMIAGIMLLALGLIWVVKNFDKVKDGAKAVWEWIKNIAEKIKDFLTSADKVKGFFTSIGEKFKRSPEVRRPGAGSASVESANVTARSITDVNLNINDPGKIVSNIFSKSRGLTNVNLGTNMEGAA